MNIGHAVADLGRSLGMDCSLDAQGVLSLELPNGDVLSLEQDLQELLGLNVKLDDKGGKGEVRIAYANLEQLDLVCRRLMNL